MQTAQCEKCCNNSQPGWRFKNDKVELFITELGGQTAPVKFNIDCERVIQPYYISPWQNEGITEFDDPVLAPLRGDFFCMPFGENSEVFNGEKHSVHGEVSSSAWHYVGFEKNGDLTTLTLDLQTTVRPGKVTKKIQLHDGHNAFYCTHILEGYSGAMPIGHHCTLAVPESENSLRLAVSSFDQAKTSPELFSNPEAGAYQSLEPAADFTDLTRVPVLWKNMPEADCTSYPQRRGFTDMLQILRRPEETPAWTVIICPQQRYLWFALKDAALMPGTVLWISNGGRHRSPWNGRNRCLGVEECCSYFVDGLKSSVADNAINAAGFPTALPLSETSASVVKFIQGAVEIPADFTEVANVTFGEDMVTFHGSSGEQVTADVDWRFLYD